MEHEREPFGRRERLEHHEQREPDRVGQHRFLLRVDPGGRLRGGLRGDLVERVFAPGRARAQHVEAHPGGDGGEPAREVLDVGRVGAAEADPRLLDRVVGLGRRAEHPVGDRPQVRPVGLEPLGQKFLVVHRSHSSVVFRQRVDGPEPADVTRTRRPPDPLSISGLPVRRRARQSNPTSTLGVTMTTSTTQGIKTVLHPVSDLAKAKEVYTALLGVAPQADSEYYVGFEAGGQHIGLLPGGGPQGMTAPVTYWEVADIEAKLAEVTAAGATVHGARARRWWRAPGGHRHRPRRQRPRAAAGHLSRSATARLSGGAPSGRQRPLPRPMEHDDPGEEGHRQEVAAGRRRSPRRRRRRPRRSRLRTRRTATI